LKQNSTFSKAAHNQIKTTNKKEKKKKKNQRKEKK